MKQLIAVAFVFVAFLLVPSAAAAQPTPPAEWTCEAIFFGADDGCDCGCGAPDPDCADTNRATCAFNGCTDGQVPTAADATACAANACGDGYRGGAETCDDGGAAGCSADCTTVDEGFSCGGNATGCHQVVCGDGIVDFFGGEACDDSNTAAGDGCSATCTEEPGFDCGFDGLVCHPVVCGDGIIDGDENCDDGNAAPGDGCDATCTEEAGFSCGAAGEACVAVPADWACIASFYAGNDGCDCGCGALDPDCGGGGCAESGCDDGDVCAFCYVDGESVGCGAGEGEGEGEGEPAGEGEGEGEGDDDDDNGLSDDPNVDTAPGCAAIPVDTSAAFALLAMTLAISRRRRR